MKPQSLRRYAGLLMVILLAAGLFLAFFHSHSAGADSQDCLACKFVHALSFLVFLFAGVFSLNFLRAPFAPVREFRFSSRASSRLRSRAPPFVS